MRESLSFNIGKRNIGKFYVNLLNQLDVFMSYIDNFDE